MHDDQRIWTNGWSDESVIDYFDAHLNATLHEICALSGRKKADVKALLLSEEVNLT